MALTSFKPNEKVQLTKNFNSIEFRCKGKNHSHDTLINVDLVKKIQAFMNENGYTKAIISSGYRCPEYNKQIGGSPSSKHTTEGAVDICFYKNGKIVPAKEVCCKAEDFGFKGIAYIDKNYVHLDDRANGIYRGDERKGFGNNVPNGDFYSYFGIPKENTYQGVFPTLPKRGYFKKGDKGTQVKYLQSFLNWAVDSKLSVDGIIGNKTIAAVKDFQRKVSIKVDGLFGHQTLVKAKEFKR